LPDFSWSKHTKTGKVCKMGTIYIYQTANIISNGHKLFQTVVKYTIIFHSKTLQNIPKLGFLVLKWTIWQPCTYVQSGKRLLDCYWTLSIKTKLGKVEFSSFFAHSNCCLFFFFYRALVQWLTRVMGCLLFGYDRSVSPCRVLHMLRHYDNTSTNIYLLQT
jgi:hypothetical protein